MPSMLSRYRDAFAAGICRSPSKIVAQVRSHTEELQALGTEKLRARCETIRSQVQQSAQEELRSSHLTNCLALITEAIRRATGKTFYDVQLLAGFELSQGKIVQMQTGEGKTLTTALPAFVQSMRRPSVHIATTNAYLANRDFEELRPAFEMLGLSVGLLPADPDEPAAREAYRCDLTFGTGYAFGFDYLRDQLAIRSQPKRRLGENHLRALRGIQSSGVNRLQTEHSFAIVDEADSVLIDEAALPLILSGGTSSSSSSLSTPIKRCEIADHRRHQLYKLADRIALNIIDAGQCDFDMSSRQLTIEEAGWQRAYGTLRDLNSHSLQRHWDVYVENAVRARLQFERDVDYVVLEDKVQIVDSHTGRIHEQRTWRDGLHQAIEVKESVSITEDSHSDARITRQRYFQLYSAMAGMSGTLQGVEPELKEFYGRDVAVIPTNRPCQREWLPSRCFADNNSRNHAIVSAAREHQRVGRPVLIGTRTIKHSRTLSDRFHSAGIPHVVLNGLQDATESDIVARAGHRGAITIATNMAGRGTDIRLCKDTKRVGGLAVIGAEPNLSRRVDRQLAGRAARQGDPGSCQFFAAADDELLLHDSDLRTQMLIDVDDSGECQRNFASKIDALQIKVETRSYEARKAMVARDHWLDDILRTVAGKTRDS